MSIRSALALAMELAGVGLVAGSLSWALHPAAGGIVAGAYLFVVAQLAGRER